MRAFGLLCPNSNPPNPSSTRNQLNEEPLCGCATSKSLFIYLFYLKKKPNSSRHSGISWTKIELGSDIRGNFQKRKKFGRCYLQLRKMDKPWQRVFSTTWKCLNWKINFTNVAIMSSLRETRNFKKVFGLQKTCGRNFIQMILKKEKMKQRRKVAFVAWKMPWLAQFLD